MPPISSMTQSTKVMLSQMDNGCNFALTYGSLFQEDVDAIVVVANSKLKLSQVTANAVKNMGGGGIQEELNKILLLEGGRLEFGKVVYTHAGDVMPFLLIQ